GPRLAARWSEQAPPWRAAPPARHSQRSVRSPKPLPRTQLLLLFLPPAQQLLPPPETSFAISKARRSRRPYPPRSEGACCARQVSRPPNQVVGPCPPHHPE